MHSVGNCVLADIDAGAAESENEAWLRGVFYNYQNPTVKGCQASAQVSRLSNNAARAPASVPLRFADADGGLAAADAFATAEVGGLGGWWIKPGCGLVCSRVSWFSFQLTRAELPDWFRNGAGAQLLLLLA